MIPLDYRRVSRTDVWCDRSDDEEEVWGVEVFDAEEELLADAMFRGPTAEHLAWNWAALLMAAAWDTRVDQRVALN